MKYSNITLRVPPGMLLYVRVRCTPEGLTLPCALMVLMVLRWGAVVLMRFKERVCVPKVDRQRKHAITTHGTRAIMLLGAVLFFLAAVVYCSPGREHMAMCSVYFLSF